MTTITRSPVARASPVDQAQDAHATVKVHHDRINGGNWQEICKGVARVNVVALKRNGAYAQHIQLASWMSNLR